MAVPIMRAVAARLRDSDRRSIDDLRLKNEQLAQAYLTLKDTVQRKSDFLTVIAHELRTPLTPVVLGVSMDEEGWDVVKPFLSELQVNYRILMGDDRTAQLYGGVNSLPTSFLIDREGRIVKDAAIGDGPIDAVFKTIERITGIDVTLRDFRVRSVTIGEDAQGEAHIEAEYEGKRVNGRAVSTDIIEASAKATPDNGNVVDSLGWAQFKLGKMAEAEATLRKAAELSPFSPEVRRHLGEVLVKQGKLAEAAEQWERALAFVFPDRLALEKRLGELRVRLARERAQKVEDAQTPAPDATPDDDEDQP